ncbi:hypothetical protein GCM10028809_46130 [Spirosoma gilvum]
MFEAGRVSFPICCTKVIGTRWYYALQTTGTVAELDEWSEFEDDNKKGGRITDMILPPSFQK